MALILDTGAAYAWYDRDDKWHEPVRELVEAEPGSLILPSAVIPEIDYLLSSAIGFNAQLAFYQDLVAPAYVVTDLGKDGHRRVMDLNRDHRDLGLGFVDASVMATAETLGLGRVATTDRRHFGAVSLRLTLQLLP